MIGAFFMTRKSRAPQTPELVTPKLAVAAVRGSSIFYTPEARDALRAQKPTLVNPTEERAFFQAEQNPALWRQLDHRLHFDALLLSGDANAYAPLLRHLLDSRDFVLTYLDQTSVIFSRRPAVEWSIGMLDAVKQQFAGAQRAPFLVGAANKLLALGMTQQAKSYLDEAISLDGDSPDTRTQLALYHAQIGQWAQAMENCERALSSDKNYTPALNAKAQILFGSKRFNEALVVSRHIVEESPRDPSALFLDAKIAHQAHAYQHEIETLHALIELAERDGAPVSGYRIYLGQAYAADSQAQPSLEQFQKALDTGDLSPEQRKFVEESIARIKSRTGS